MWITPSYIHIMSVYNLIVILLRLHAKHPSNGEFRRMIAFVSGMYYKMAFLVKILAMNTHQVMWF